MGGWRGAVVVRALRAARDAEERAARPFDWPRSRRRAEVLVPPSAAARRATLEPVSLPTCPGEWVRPAGADERRALLFLHAGGFTGGSARQHRDLVARLAEACGCAALVVDYHLAPEHPFPAALDDARAAYTWLLGRGFDPADVAVVGNSAGGGLALLLLLDLRARAVPLPACAVLLSPWADLTLTAPSLTTNAHTDWCSLRSLVAQRDAYVAGRDPRDPLLSPVFGDLRGLPPVWCATGGGEMLRDDGRALAATGAVSLDEAPGLPHVYPALPFVREAGPALARAGAFVWAHTTRPTTRSMPVLGAVEERWVASGEARLRVRTVGPPEGPLVVLLHGFPEHGFTFRHLAPALARSGYRAAMVDQRGCGESSCPSRVESYGKDQLADDVVAVIRALGRERAHVVGHDWGGIVGWWLAMRHPERVDRFVAIAAPHPDVFAAALRRPGQLARSAYVGLFQVPWLPERALRARRGALLTRLLRGAARRGVVDADVGVSRQAWLEPGRLEAMLAWYRAVFLAPAGRPGGARVSAPTLVVWGSDDPALDPALAAASARVVAGGRSVVLPGVGHFVTWEAPEALARLVVGHLGGAA
jgi:acetyl esterase/lipase